MQETLARYVSQELLHDRDGLELGGDDNLLTTGLIDSLGIMQLIAFIEQEFDIQVQPEDITIENFRTINVIVGYLQRQKV